MTNDTGTDDRRGLGAQLWGAVKGALVDEDPVAAARRAKLQAGHAPSGDTGPAAGDAAAQAPLSAMGKTLLAQVLARPTAYTALTEKLEPLEAIVLDERTRYQAAYALIRSTRSVEQLVQAIDMQHVQALDDEAARFAAQLKDKEHAEIDARSQELQSLSTGIDAAAQQVARLREEAEARIRQIEASVARDRERQAQLTREVEAKRQELAAVQRQFDAAARSVAQVLATAKATLLRHLG